MSLSQIVSLGTPNSSASKTLTYQTAAMDTTDSTKTYTFSGVAIGTAAVDRRVHVTAHTFNIGTPTISSITIGGILATINASRSVAGNTGSAIATALVPTGTTADIVVTWTSSSDSTGCHVGVWSSVGLATSGAYDSDSSVANPQTATLSTLDGGFCIASTAQVVAGTVTWTNATERFDQTDADNHASSGASAATTGADISPSGQWSVVGSGGAVFATF